jgi:ADP-ribose pyrophosphatase
VNRRPIHKGRVVDLGIETATLPDGRQLDLEVIRHPGAAAILPLHADGTVTLVHQHRHAAGGLIYEVPAGKLDNGEAPEVCAVRELAEEVQLQAGRLEPLGPIFTTPGFTDEQIWLFVAHDLSPAPGQPEADEYIRVVRLPLAEVWAMVHDGRITDGKTICALARATGPGRR